MSVVRDYIDFAKSIGDRAPTEDEIKILMSLEALIRYEDIEL